MNNCFIILAAGQSKRFKSIEKKQNISYKNKPLYQHSIDKAVESGLFKKIILVTNNVKIKKTNFSKNLIVVSGGKRRCDSSLKGLKVAQKFSFKNVLIHDAARPDFSITLLKRLIKSLKKYDAVIPYVNATNAVKYIKNKSIINLDKNKTILTQTPQAFKFNKILIESTKNKLDIPDESSLFVNKSKSLKFIRGEPENKKITFNKDLIMNNVYFGIGFDIHRLVKNRKFYLGGLKIKSKLGTLGHSDGDPVLHAITDSILGACRKGDIGQKFSNKDKKFKNIRSTILLNNIINEIKKEKFFINNIDINIITETPKISKLKIKLINSISKICEIDKNKINIKGKSTEKLGIIGKSKAIACEVITSVSKYDQN